MIDRMPLLPLSSVDSDRWETRRAIPEGQATQFLNLLIQTLSVAEKGSSHRSAGPTGVSLSTGMPDFPLLSVAFQGRDLKKDALDFVLQQEGSGYVARDGGRECSRYGILQGTASRWGYPGDVKNMSRQEAEGIYERIWQESGAQSLPRNLALVHFDTYVNSPSAAKKMLKSSGGSPETYLELRSQRYKRLTALRPERYDKYIKGWMNRIRNLKFLVAEDSYTPSAKGSTRHG
jgi:hypothetical protein